MKMFNYEVEAFAEFLLSLELSGKQSRMRTKFVKICAEKVKEVSDDKNDLIKEYGEKEENGELKTTQHEGGHTTVAITDVEAFNREITTLMTEEFIIDETYERQDMIQTVKNIVLETDKGFSGQEAFTYDRWCEIVEGE